MFSNTGDQYASVPRWAWNFWSSTTRTISLNFQGTEKSTGLLTKLLFFAAIFPYLTYDAEQNNWLQLEVLLTNFSCSFQNGGYSRRLQGEKTFCVSPAQASDHSLSQAQAFLLTVFVCNWSSEWTTRDANVSGLLFVRYFCVTCLLFLRHLKITLDSEQPMLKKKQIIPSVWGGIKSFEHFQRGEYFFSDSAFD